MRRNESALLLVCLMLVAGAASAQENPELGDTGASAGGSAQAQGTWQPPTGTVDNSAASADANAPTVSGESDHAQFVGRFGVGFFGVQDLPVGACPAGSGCAGGANTLYAPTIGARYWLSETMGIEAALGFAITSGSTETTITGAAGGGSGEVNDVSYLGFALHGGLPLVFATSRHFTFQVVPELNFGVAGGSWDDTSPANADVDLSGLFFEIGARVGAEIHFGFIDIPQLSLQGTVGAHLGVTNRGSTVTAGGTETEVSQSSFRFGTSLQGEPWDIFVGNLTAIYYF